MTLYDKRTREGVRVFLDAKKVENWPEIKAWYLKLKPKRNRTGKNLTGKYGKRETVS
jgi:formylmethanofuran dehydrogenase subunit E